MTVQIEKKITGFHVAQPKATELEPPIKAVSDNPIASPPVAMDESVERPEVLLGSTYKIKSPMVEHSLYVTINDMILNRGTDYECRRPFEVFINSKNMDHFQWIVALTRIMSAVFRKGGDVAFLADELRAVFDPKGGYFKPGGVFVHSLVAEIGLVIEQHLKYLGLIDAPEMSESQRNLIASKRAEYESRQVKPAASPNVAEDPDGSPSFPPGASECHKCHAQALIRMDGCDTCLNCGYSKCG